jgi:histidinol dehydrogenase
MIRRISVPPFDALGPLLPQRAGGDPATREAVARILDDVLLRGDDAVREYTRRFDGVDLPPSEWELDSAGWQGALHRVNPALRAALALAVTGCGSTTSTSGSRDFTSPGRTAAWWE